MTGEMVYIPPRTHTCAPKWFKNDLGFHTHAPKDTLWRCSCGQHWLSIRLSPAASAGYAAKNYWRPVSDRRARRALRKAGK